MTVDYYLTGGSASGLSSIAMGQRAVASGENIDRTLRGVGTDGLATSTNSDRISGDFNAAAKKNYYLRHQRPLIFVQSSK